MRNLKHPNICKLVDVLWNLDSNSKISLVMEWMETDLAKYIDSKTEPIGIFNIQSIML